MIPFRCPHCGLVTQVAPQYAGQSGPCAGCGRTITVPAASAAALPALSRRQRPTFSWLVALLVCLAVSLTILLVAGLLIQLVRPAVTGVRLNARRSVCHAQVTRLLRAMDAYQRDHGTLPPAYSTDAQGKPLHSWRVLLLPYLGAEGQAIYFQLKLDEPWDSPHNQPYSVRTPEFFLCPDDRPIAAGDTSYCVVTGDRYAFRAGTGVSPEQFLDDSSTTLLIVEVQESGINWMEPDDVSAIDLAQGINSGIRGSCGSRHPGGVATVGTADGRAHSLSDSIRPDDLHDMARIDGGEKPNPIFSP